MTDTEITRIELPFTFETPEGSTVQTFHEDRLLSEWPTESVLLKGDSSMATPVTLTSQNAAKLLKAMPGHPRNTALEWLEDGGILKVQWGDRSLRISGFLPAVEKRADGSTAPGALFRTMEEMVSESLNRNGQPIAWTVYWGWNWDNSTYAYDQESYSISKLRLDSSGRFHTGTYRHGWDGITLKRVRELNHENSPVMYEHARQDRLAKAAELDAKVSTYDPQGPVPTAIREAAKAHAESLMEYVRREYEWMKAKASDMLDHLDTGNDRQARRLVGNDHLVVDPVQINGRMDAAKALLELGQYDGEVRNDHLHTIVEDFAKAKEQAAAWMHRLVKQDPSDDAGRWGCSPEERAMYRYLLDAFESIDRAVERAS